MTDLHRISHRDAVSGGYCTRCGLSGFLDYSSTRPSGALLMLSGTIAIADGEAATTCKKCMLKLTPTQKKILRLLLDRHITVLYPSNSFKWDANAMWAKKKDFFDLMSKGLTNGLRLTSTGKQIAATLPKAPHDNSLHRLSRRRVQSGRKNMGKA